MSTLVIFFSRTGNTRRIGAAIAQELGAQQEELRTRERWEGALGYLRAARAAVRRTPVTLEPVSQDPRRFEVVIVGTPVWAFTMAAPVRTFLSEHGPQLCRVAFFCTLGGSGAQRTFRHMESLCGRPALATLAVTERDLRSDVKRAVQEFTARLRAALAADQPPVEGRP